MTVSLSLSGGKSFEHRDSPPKHTRHTLLNNESRSKASKQLTHKQNNGLCFHVSTGEKANEQTTSISHRASIIYFSYRPNEAQTQSMPFIHWSICSLINHHPIFYLSTIMYIFVKVSLILLVF